MRKMKKINGFLVVRFNDREKRDYPQLGNFGVIDAESYTGDIDIDRGAMEYDDADTIEVAVEQARGLDAEQDYSDEPPVYTVTVESAEGSSEETVEPQMLIKGWEKLLKAQVKSKHYPGIDPRAAAHELNGYKTALRDLGLMGEDDVGVAPDHFAPGMTEQPLPKEPEELLAYVCDKVCKHLDKCGGQDELDTACAKCSVGRLMSEANDRDLRVKDAATERLDDLIQELSETQLNTRAERLEHEARAYLEAISTTKILAEHEATAYKSAISEAVKVERWAADPPTLTPQEVQELRNLRELLKEVEDYVNGGTKAPPGQIMHAKLEVVEPHDRKRLLEEQNAYLEGQPPTDHEPPEEGAQS